MTSGAAQALVDFAPSWPRWGPEVDRQRGGRAGGQASLEGGSSSSLSFPLILPLHFLTKPVLLLDVLLLVRHGL